MTSKLETLLENLKALEAKSDEAEKAYVAEPENAEAEAAFDRTYSEEHEALTTAVEEIVNLTKGDIKRDIARKMLLTSRAEVETLARMLTE